jgi:hypothetical protein
MPGLELNLPTPIHHAERREESEEGEEREAMKWVVR